MLNLQDTSGSYSDRLSRRALLQVGALGGLGINPTLIGHARVRAGESEATRAPGFGRAKAVIVVFASGGQSQLDMWDPKPDAPAEIRGAFDSIETAIPGARFCEHMPRIAGVADKLCVLRSMSHEDLDHGSAFYLAMTGRYHTRRSSNPLPTPDDAPCPGAILHRVRPNTEFVKTAVHLNGPAEVPKVIAPGQFGGVLGKGYDPLTLGDVTLDQIPIPSLRPHDDVPTVRLRARQSLLDAVEDATSRLDGDPRIADQRTLHRQAFDMLARSETRSAFDLSQESETLRDRYGRNRSGQACLLARRLVEAGVPLLTVIWNHNNRGQDLDPTSTDLYGWDTHNDIFVGLRDYLLPRFDQGFTALIEDLDQRGLLDETLVVCMGEFGRAPLVALEPRFAGASPGRKHWSWVYSIALAGAGVAPGTVVGASDAAGAYPASDRYGPWDVVATMFSALGIDPHQHYTDQIGRPVKICEGQPIEPVYA